MVPICLFSADGGLKFGSLRTQSTTNFRSSAPEPSGATPKGRDRSPDVARPPIRRYSDAETFIRKFLLWEELSERLNQ